jgi:hypothetical protein
VKEKQKPQLHTSEFSTVAVHSHTVPRNVTKETLSKTAQKLPSERKENKGIAKPISQPTVSPDLTIKNKEGAYQSIRNEHNHEEKDESSPPATKRSDDVFEKKRQHAMQYQRYLQREGPKNPGGKVVPQVLDYVESVMCSVL